MGLVQSAPIPPQRRESLAQLSGIRNKIGLFNVEPAVQGASLPPFSQFNLTLQDVNQIQVECEGLLRIFTSLGLADAWLYGLNQSLHLFLSNILKKQL